MDIAKGSHGGARAGAGRKALERHGYVLHRARTHAVMHPMHITLRAVGGLPSLRAWEVLSLLILQMRRLNDAFFQIVHFSLQTNHLHLIAEADDRETVSRKMTGFKVSLAKRLNRFFGRSGTIWRERYYCRDVATPREMHRVLAYVFGNAKKHGLIPRDAAVLDPFSSAWTFDGFGGGVDVRLPPERARWTPPKPRTALLENEWVVYGCIPV